MNVLHELKKLDEQREALRASAKKEVLERVNAAIAELAELGFSYRLIEGKTRQIHPDTPCRICKFPTEPYHDARKHRGQKPQKAFSAKELEEKGLKRKI